jgi:hypothetical protein
MITILSFPRSGNHFVRYIVEFLTGKATVGAAGFTTVPGQDTPICLRKGPECLKHVKLDDRIAVKSHFVDSIPENVSGLVLLVRHPIESILSHRYHNISRSGGFSNNFSENIINTLKQDSKNFTENLDYYEKFKKDKSIVLYEDLIGDNYKKSIHTLSEMFYFENSNMNSFIENFEKYRLDSMKSPHRKPISSSKKNKEQFYGEYLKRSNINNYNKYIETISEVLNHSLIRELYD